jgi:xylan 1,4-beta-xylosidase
VRRALPTARVGGPDSAGAGGQWTRNFIEHCLHGTNYATGKIGTPFNFFSFHAKGAPGFVDDHVRMGIANQINAIDAGFSIAGSYPELKNIPIIIGESDPDGCAACTGDQLGYRNTTMYSSYTAASVAREWELARRYGVNLDSALTWAFTFPGQLPFAGFRQLAGDGIDLPVLNVFRMFSRMSGQQLAVTSDGAISLEDLRANGVRGRPDVSAVASLDKEKLTVLVWHYHDDDVPGPEADVSLDLQNLPADIRRAKLTGYAIDAEHSNAFTVWQKLGSPLPLAGAQYDEVEKAGKLTTIGKPKNVRVKGGQLKLNLPVPRQAVELLVFELNPTRK